MQRWRTRHDVRGICSELPPFALGASAVGGGTAGGGFDLLGALSGLFGGSASGGGGQSQNNLGLNVLPVQANFLDPTSTSTFDPTVFANPTVTQGNLSNSLILGPQIAGPHTSSSASLFGSAGGGGGGGDGGGNVSDNINYAPQTTLVSNLPPPLQMPGQQPMNLGSINSSPRIQMMPMPPTQAGMMMPTTQPIAAGGVSPVLASMMAIPQQQQLSQGQLVIPGSASQAGGYDLPQAPPMPMSSANAMGIPNMGGGMMMPQMAPSAAPGNIMTAGGNQVPFSQALASRGNVTLPGGYQLTPPPAASQPSLAQLGPGYGEPESTSQESRAPMSPEQQEEDALNRAEAATKEGSTAVDRFLASKKLKADKRDEEKRPRIEAAAAALTEAHRMKRQLQALQQAQRTPEGQRLLEGQAKLDADAAIDDRRAGGNFSAQQRPLPSQQHPILARFGPPKMRRMIAAQDFVAGGSNAIAAREQENQTGSLWNTVYTNSLNYYRRDTSNEIKQADTDIKEAQKDLKDIDVEFDKREKRERQDDLDDLRANLNKVRLAQNTAKFEGITGQRAIQNRLGQRNLEQNIKRTAAQVPLNQERTKGQQLLNQQKEKGFPSGIPAPGPNQDMEGYRKALFQGYKDGRWSKEDATKAFYMGQAKGFK